MGNDFSYVIVSHKDDNFKSLILPKTLFGMEVGMKVNDADKVSMIRIGNQKTPTQMHGIAVDDDYDGNISHLNSYLNELTGIHAAWRKYETVCKNADRIYFNHYRRVFPIKDYDSDFDGVFSLVDKCRLTARDRVEQTYEAGQKNTQVKSILLLIDEMQKQMEKWKFEDITQTKYQIRYSTKFYICSMFMFKKELFFKYCEWLFPYALKTFQLYEELCKLNPFMKFYPRTPGYICEFLSSMFFERCIEDRNLKIDTRQFKFII